MTSHRLHRSTHSVGLMFTTGFICMVIVCVSALFGGAR